MKRWWRRVRPYVLSRAIFTVANAIGATLRIQTENWEAVRELPTGRIFAGLHGRSMIPARFFKGMGFWAIISLSRDGEMQSRIFTLFGFQILRGSSGRGGERALIESIRVLKKGDTMAITPDGPRGPSGVVQPGILLMAKKSGCAIIPVGSSAKRGWYAPTWDNYLIPFPFSKASFVFGEPVYVPANASDEEIEEIRQHVEAKIHEVQTRAEELVGAKPPAPKKKG